MSDTKNIYSFSLLETAIAANMAMANNLFILEKISLRALGKWKDTGLWRGQWGDFIARCHEANTKYFSYRKNDEYLGTVWSCISGNFKKNLRSQTSWCLMRISNSWYNTQYKRNWILERTKDITRNSRIVLVFFTFSIHWTYEWNKTYMCVWLKQMK